MAAFEYRQVFFSCLSSDYPPTHTDWFASLLGRDSQAEPHTYRFTVSPNLPAPVFLPKGAFSKKAVHYP